MRFFYKPALPSRYKSVAESFGVVGAIAVECSPLVEDNDWLLRTAALDPLSWALSVTSIRASPGSSS